MSKIKVFYAIDQDITDFNFRISMSYPDGTIEVEPELWQQYIQAKENYESLQDHLIKLTNNQ